MPALLLAAYLLTSAALAAGLWRTRRTPRVTRCAGSCAYVQAPHTWQCYVTPCAGHPTPTTLDGITDETGATAYYPPF